jgi:hypothetical protein
LGFEPLVTDSCLYINRQDGILVVTYVDDFLALAPKGDELDAFIYELRSKWTLEELGNVKYFLDIRIVRDKEHNKLYLYQDAYIDKILDRYSMNNNKLIDTPITSSALKLIVPFDSIASKKDIE